MVVSVECRSQNVARRPRGSSRLFVVAILAVATCCLILARSISHPPAHSPNSLLGDPFEPDSQDEQMINPSDHSERLLTYGGTTRDTRRDTDDIRRLRRSDGYDRGDDAPAYAELHPSSGIRGAVSGDKRGSGNADGGLMPYSASASGASNYNVNALNGQDSDISGALSYISSPVTGYGSDVVGGDITSSLNRNIRDIQKLQQQITAPQHALRRSKLAVLRRDDKMLQSRLLDTLKLQESQIVAETAAVKRLSASLQRLRGRTQEDLQQRATTAQLNDAMFDLKRLAAMQKAEYKSLMLTKAQPGPPGLPGPRGLPGRNGINGSPGSIQELVPVSRNRLSAVPPGHWADEGLFRRSHPASARAGLSFLPPSLPPAIPPPYQPFPNKIETLPNGVKCVLPQSLAFLSVEYLLELIPSFCRYQTHWGSKDGQRSWDIHPPIRRHIAAVMTTI